MSAASVLADSACHTSAFSVPWLAHSMRGYARHQHLARWPASAEAQGCVVVARRRVAFEPPSVTADGAPTRPLDSPWPKGTTQTCVVQVLASRLMYRSTSESKGGAQPCMRLSAFMHMRARAHPLLVRVSVASGIAAIRAMCGCVGSSLSAKRSELEAVSGDVEGAARASDDRQQLLLERISAKVVAGVGTESAFARFSNRPVGALPVGNRCVCP